MNVLGIIPARFASSRLPGKPLADIHGKPMIQHVYERSSQAFDHVVVATDDDRIVSAVESFGGKAILTSVDHNTGTNRCLEAYNTYIKLHNYDIDVIVNIQGDEPLIDPVILKQLSDTFLDPDVKLATLATQVQEQKDLFNENRVFVVKDAQNDALYFSRWPIPHLRGVAKEDWLKQYDYLKHIGLYAYRPEALASFAAMPMSSLEKAESLEQNRWLEAGNKIRVEICNDEGVAVDTAEDLEKVRSIFRSL